MNTLEILKNNLNIDTDNHSDYIIENVINTKQSTASKIKEMILCYDTENTINFHGKKEIQNIVSKLITTEILNEVEKRECYGLIKTDETRIEFLKKFDTEESIDELFGGIFYSVAKELDKNALKYFSSLAEFIYDFLVLTLNTRMFLNKYTRIINISF